MKNLITAALVGLVSLAGVASAAELRIINNSSAVIQVTPVIEGFNDMRGAGEIDRLSTPLLVGQQVSIYDDKPIKVPHPWRKGQTEDKYTSKVNVHVNLAGFSPGTFVIDTHGLDNHARVLRFDGSIFDIRFDDYLQYGEQDNENNRSIPIR